MKELIQDPATKRTARYIISVVAAFFLGIVITVSPIGYIISNFGHIQSESTFMHDYGTKAYHAKYGN